MNSTPPIISVVIPLYNKEKYIAQTIESVLTQTFRSFELIIIDDGSTDMSSKIVRSYQDNRIKYYFQENRGLSATRNQGIKKSVADWIAFLDADDEYEPTFLEEVYNFIQQYSGKNIAFVGTSCKRSNNQKTFEYQLETGIYCYHELFYNLHTPNNSSSTVVNKGAIIRVGGFPDNISKYYEDWHTWLRLTEQGSFGYINKTLSIYRVVNGSITQSKLDSYAYVESVNSILSVLDRQIRDEQGDPHKRVIIERSKNNFLFNASVFLISNGDFKSAVKFMKKVNFGKLRNISLKKLFKLVINHTYNKIQRVYSSK